MKLLNYDSFPLKYEVNSIELNNLFIEAFRRGVKYALWHEAGVNNCLSNEKKYHELLKEYFVEDSSIFNEFHDPNKEIGKWFEKAGIQVV